MMAHMSPRAFARDEAAKRFDSKLNTPITPDTPWWCSGGSAEPTGPAQTTGTHSVPSATGDVDDDDDMVEVEETSEDEVPVKEETKTSNSRRGRSMMPSSDEEEEEEGDAFYEEVMEVEDSEVEDGSEDEGAGRVGAGRAEVPEEAVTAVTSNLVEKNSTQPVASKRLSKEESKRPLLSKKMFEKVPRRKKKRGLKEKKEYHTQRWNNMRTARGTPVNRRRVRQSDILESDMEEAATTDEESETETRRLQWVQGMSVQVPFKCDGETVWFPGVLLKRLKRQGEKKWMVHFLDGDNSAVCESKLKPVCT